MLFRSDTAYRLAGNERLTKEQAVLDAKARRIFDRMLAYRAEFAPMYEADPIASGRWFVKYEEGIWSTTCHNYWYIPSIVYLPEKVADDLVVKLNAGTVVF